MNTKSLYLPLLCVSSLIFSAHEGTCETCDSKYSWSIVRNMCRRSGTPKQFKEDVKHAAVVAGAVAAVGTAVVVVAPHVAYPALNYFMTSVPVQGKIAITGAAYTACSSGDDVQWVDAPTVEPIVSKSNETNPTGVAGYLGIAGLAVANKISGADVPGKIVEKLVDLTANKVIEKGSNVLDKLTGEDKRKAEAEEERKKAEEDRVDREWAMANESEQVSKSNNALAESNKELARAQREMAFHSEQNTKALGGAINQRRSGVEAWDSYKEFMKDIQGLDEQKE